METLKLISEEIQDVEYLTEQKENGKKDYKIKQQPVYLKCKV